VMGILPLAVQFRSVRIVGWKPSRARQYAGAGRRRSAAAWPQ